MPNDCKHTDLGIFGKKCSLVVGTLGNLYSHLVGLVVCNKMSKNDFAMLLGCFPHCECKSTNKF